MPDRALQEGRYRECLLDVIAEIEDAGASDPSFAKSTDRRMAVNQKPRNGIRKIAPMIGSDCPWVAPTAARRFESKPTTAYAVTLIMAEGRQVPPIWKIWARMCEKGFSKPVGSR